MVFPFEGISEKIYKQCMFDLFIGGLLLCLRKTGHRNRQFQALYRTGLGIRCGAQRMSVTLWPQVIRFSNADANHRFGTVCEAVYTAIQSRKAGGYL